MPGESIIEKEVVKRAKAAGWEVRKVQWIGHSGAPDRLFMKPGHKPIFIEFKDRGEEPTPQQLGEHERLRDCGFVVEWFNGIGMACRYLGILLEVDPLRPNY